MKQRVVLLTLIASLLLAGCSVASSAPVVATPGAADSVSMDAIVATVSAQIDDRQPQPEPTLDVAALQATILAAVEDRLAAASPESLARLVDDTVASRLAEQQQAEEPGVDTALIDLYQKANPAVVYIVVPPVGSGSGFVYSADGYIVTNNHVVNGGRAFEVVFSDGEHMPATLVGTDTDSDLAVLQVEALPEGTEPLPLAEPDSLKVGQFVVAIGNPFGEQGSMSLGIVSGLDRSLRSQRISRFGSSYSLPSVIQTDAPINPGNSGGPLLNLDGEVVGINAAIASQTGFNSGVGFSIPVIAVRQVVPSLIEKGSHDYSYLGASFANEIGLSEQEQFGLPQTQGAYVIGVTQGGPADNAGLIAADPNTGRGGDLIIAIDDRTINSFDDLNTYLAFYTTIGQTIDVTVLRDGAETSVPITLGPRP
ncbi:MAG: trypsin-like peptidase domain-containing protein [Caldilineales bacterium]